MQTLIDLHTHSSYSDGTLSPKELVHCAKEHDVGILSLTDHDTIDGIEEAFVTGQKLGIEVVAGVEISAIHNDTNLHMLGYGFNPKDVFLTKLLNKVQFARRERNKIIVGKLKKMGLEISFDELLREKGKQTGRPHIAQLLVQKGYVKNIEAAFKHFLRDGGPAYEEGYKLDAKDAIDIIQKAGGLAILAHPAKINVSKIAQTNLIMQLVSYGLGGIEVYYPRHSQKEIKRLKKIAEQYNLLLTGGSDFHGIAQHAEILGGSEKKSRLPHEIWLDVKKKLITPNRPKAIDTCYG